MELRARRFWLSLFVPFFVILSINTFAQSPKAGPSHGRETKHGQVNVTQLAAWEAAMPIFKGRQVPVHEPLRDPRIVPLGPRAKGTKAQDPDEGRDHGQLFGGGIRFTDCDPPIDSFFGLDDVGPFYPPDTHGAVGLNHVVSSTNNAIRFHTRTGTIIATVTQEGFWSSLGPFSFGPFDPKMAYDPYQDRYMAVALDGSDTTSNILLGVSQTGDPTGTWNLYKIKSDATSQNWFDYPTIGFNKKWIVLNGNMFPVANSSYYNALFVFDKQSMYSGGPANYTRFTDSLGFNLAPALTYDANLDDLFVVDSFDGASGTLRLNRIKGAVGAEQFEFVANSIVPQTWFFGNPAANQLGTGSQLDTIDERIINAVYRNGRVWCTHGVEPISGPPRASVHWCEIDAASGGVIQSGLIDDPSGANFSWIPSIAVNQNGDAAVGFARSSGSQYAGAYYAFRLAADTPGVMRPECLLKAGEGPYDNFRWGDYSATQVDPTDNTTFWTVQEYAVAPQDRFATWWGHFAAIPPPITLSISPNVVIAGDSATGTILLGAPAPFGGASVNITVDDPTAVTFSTPVVIPEGGTSGTFPIGTSGNVNGTTVVNFTATYGPDTSSAQLTIRPYISAVEFFDPFSGKWFPSHFEVGGGTVSGRVTLNFPADEPDGTVVDLTSDFPDIVSVTPSITIQGGQKVGFFTLFTNPVAQDTPVAITASAHGSSAFSFDTVLAPVPISLNVSPNTVAGGSNATGLVSLNGVAPAGGLLLQLSSDSQYATVDSDLLIQPGKSYGAFPIATTLPPASVTANIGASYNGVTASATLRITGIAVSNFVINPSTVAGGNQTTGVVTLARSAPAQGLDIEFSSSSPVINPANLHINPGQTQGMVVIKTTPTASNTLVPIEARVAGSAPGSGKTASLLVTATGVTSVTVTPTVMHAGTTTLNGWVFLTNPAPASGAVVTLTLTPPGEGSTNPSGSVKVLAGATKAQFSFTAPGMGGTRPAKVTVKATYPAGVTKSADIRILYP